MSKLKTIELPIKPVFLQSSIDICEKIEKREIDITAVPYIDSQTEYLISVLPKCDFIEWKDCTPNSQPDWLAFRPDNDPNTTLFLKNKRSKKVYLITK